MRLHAFHVAEKELAELDAKAEVLRILREEQVGQLQLDQLASRELTDEVEKSSTCCEELVE